MIRTTLRNLLLTGFGVLLLTPILAQTQTAELRYETVERNWNSAKFDGKRRAYVAVTEVVRVEGRDWVRLDLSGTELGHDSRLQIKSLKDGGVQTHNARTLQEWSYSTAYFNGDAVELRLIVGRSDRGVSVSVKGVEANLPNPGPLSQCGPTDDRVPSNDPRSGRIVPIGCTGWIIDNGLQLTAGHCSGGSAKVLQFNVPQSNPNGSINNPPPQDQYAIDPSTKKWTSGGIGNDWGVFQVFNSPQTNLQPIEAQGSSFTLAQDLNPANIRITGFGVDSTPSTRNQTQQTHVGPNAGSSGTTMRYVTDTEGGNSGSPVIDEATGNAVGIHTHGGCSTSGSGNNFGTSAVSSAFWAAANPSLLVSATVPGGAINFGLGGGTYSFSVLIQNVSMQTQTFDFWTYVKRNAGLGAPTDVLYSSRNITLGANQNTTLQLTQTVPAVDPGKYVYFCAVGPSVGNVLFQDSYYITIDAPINGSVAGKSTAGEWTVTELQKSDALADVAPASFTLDQNYPNPFNPTTKISYNLKANTHVTLSVYNTMGQKVKTLVNGYQEGQQNVTWNATNESGQKVAAGIYMYRLEAGDFVKTIKMTLAK